MLVENFIKKSSFFFFRKKKNKKNFFLFLIKKKKKKKKKEFGFLLKIFFLNLSLGLKLNRVCKSTSF